MLVGAERVRDRNHGNGANVSVPSEDQTAALGHLRRLENGTVEQGTAVPAVRHGQVFGALSILWMLRLLADQPKSHRPESQKPRRCRLIGQKIGRHAHTK